MKQHLFIQVIWNDFIDTDLNDGGVHINSGIINRAFYITATEIGGNSWKKAGLIWV